jgi:hypothetical protein
VKFYVLLLLILYVLLVLTQSVYTIPWKHLGFSILLKNSLTFLGNIKLSFLKCVSKTFFISFLVFIISFLDILFVYRFCLFCLCFLIVQNLIIFGSCVLYFLNFLNLGSPSWLQIILLSFLGHFWV